VVDMTVTEYECLNSIRFAMKIWLRWEWHMQFWDRVYAAMSHLEDKLRAHNASII
jgi:hypothetical protein